MVSELSAAIFPLLTLMFFILFSIIAIAIFLTIFWIWGIIDCLTSKLDPANKLFWLVIILAFNFIGVVAYLIISRRKKIKVVAMKTKKGPKHIFRSKKSRIIAGVCGGLGKYFNIDPTIIRLVWILITLFTGLFIGIIAYIIAWVIMPEEK